MAAPNNKSLLRKERKPGLGPGPEGPGPGSWARAQTHPTQSVPVLGQNLSELSHSSSRPSPTRESCFWYVFVTIVGQNGDGELAGTSLGAEFRCASFWMGLGGSIPSSENIFPKKTKQKKHWSGQSGSREFGKWEVFRCPKWVAVARYGLSMGGNESYGFWEAFGTPPGPPGGHKKIKNPRKPRKSGFPGSAA